MGSETPKLSRSCCRLRPAQIGGKPSLNYHRECLAPLMGCGVSWAKGRIVRGELLTNHVVPEVLRCRSHVTLCMRWLERFSYINRQEISPFKLPFGHPSLLPYFNSISGSIPNGAGPMAELFHSKTAMAVSRLGCQSIGAWRRVTDARSLSTR